MTERRRLKQAETLGNFIYTPEIYDSACENLSNLHGLRGEQNRYQYIHGLSLSRFLACSSVSESPCAACCGGLPPFPSLLLSVPHPSAARGFIIPPPPPPCRLHCTATIHLHKGHRADPHRKQQQQSVALTHPLWLPSQICLLGHSYRAEKNSSLVVGSFGLQGYAATKLDARNSKPPMYLPIVFPLLCKYCIREYKYLSHVELNDL